MLGAGGKKAVAYLKRTPIRCAERHATSQDRVKISGLMMSLKKSGMPIGPLTSKQAPVSERLRTVQSMAGAFAKQIEPPLNVRCRWLLRCSPVKRQSSKGGPSRSAGASCSVECRGPHATAAAFLIGRA